MKKIIIIGAVFLVAVLSVVAFFVIDSKPDKLTEKEKEKALTKILGRKANTEGEKTGNVSYSGKYASFVYPAKAKVYKYVDPDSKKNKSIVERLSFDIEDPRLILIYTVEQNPNPVGTIEDYPAVKLREDKSSGYVRSGFTVDSERGITFSKSGSGEARAEKTSFFLRGNLIYTISITGTNIIDITDLFKLITGSFTFNT